MTFVNFFMQGIPKEISSANNSIPRFSMEVRGEDKRSFKEIKECQIVGELTKVNYQIQTMTNLPTTVAFLSYSTTTKTEALNLRNRWKNYYKWSGLLCTAFALGSGLTACHTVYQLFNRNSFIYYLFITTVFAGLSFVAYSRTISAHDQYLVFKGYISNERAVKINNFRNEVIREGLRKFVESKNLPTADSSDARLFFNQNEQAYLLAKYLSPKNTEVFYSKLLPHKLDEPFEIVVNAALKGEDWSHLSKALCEDRTELAKIFATASLLENVEHDFTQIDK